jgi:uncharacterized RDD family membrane protein YckC
MAPKSGSPKKTGVFSTEKFFEGVFRSDRATLFHRVFARLIDLFIASFLATGFIYPAGPAFALAYVLLGDALFSGQSIGKRLIGLRVISLHSSEPVEFKQSAIRNLPFGTAFFFALLPVWGWIICLIVGIPLLLLEFILIMRLSSGFRLGDVMADTAVIHGPSLLRDWKALKIKKQRVQKRRGPGRKGGRRSEDQLSKPTESQKKDQKKSQKKSPEKKQESSESEAKESSGENENDSKQD